MEFEDLVWVLIFLVYVVAAIFKRVISGVARKIKAKVHQKTQKEGKARVKKRSRWQERIEAFLTKLREELEAAKQTKSEEALDWEKVLSRDEESPEPQPEPESLAMEIPPPPKVEEAPQPLVTAPVGLAETVLPPLDEEVTTPRTAARGTWDLKKAIVWKELLSPPLALRKR